MRKTGRDVRCHQQAPLLLKLSDPCCFKVGFIDIFFVNIYLMSRYGQRGKKLMWFTSLH